MVIEYIDRKEQRNIDEPSLKWDAHGLEKQAAWSCREREVVQISDCCYEEELEEREKCSCGTN